VSWDSPSIVHQKSRQLNLLVNCDFFLIFKNYNWNKDDVKLKVDWLKKGVILLVIQLAINESNYLKVKHLDKLNSLNALNWSINISNSCKLIHSHNKNFYSAFNWAIYVSTFCKLKQSNKSKISSAMTNNWK
jgi:hypothetical protein